MTTKLLSSHHTCILCAKSQFTTPLATVLNKSALNAHARTLRSPVQSAAFRPVSGKFGLGRSRRRQETLIKASDRDSDLADTLKDDLERFQKKLAAGSASPDGIKNSQAEKSSSLTGGLKETLDKVLIADFFFILVALAWLAAGVGEKSTLNSSRLLDAWYPLWMLVFQPALGVLMLGALVSGAAGWLKNRSSA